MESMGVYLPAVVRDCKNCYFLDSVNGSDSNSGIEFDQPWKTLARLQAETLSPGSTVLFKRGSIWNGGLYIQDSGTPEEPILYTAFGEGERPIFINPGDGQQWTSGVMIYADWIIVEDLLTKDARNAGVYIAEGSDFNTLRDIESTDVGIGISVLGQHNLVRGNYIHDLKMIRNTVGGSEDDYGAVGIWLGNSHNEISYNRMIRCIAPSYDFGTDGGAVEWYGFADSNYVHHNFASENKGFMEIGGGSANDTVVAYNVSIDNGRFSIFHLDNQFQSEVRNFRLENNTIIETGNEAPGWVVFGFAGLPDPETFILRNNILYIENFQAVSNQSTFTHEHNLYFMGSGVELGFSLGQAELIADPLFMDRSAGNYRLQSSSPAIDQGLNLSYTLDFDNRPVYSGSAPDLGAYEAP